MKHWLRNWLTAALLLVASPVSAAMLTVCGEDINCVLQGTVTQQTLAGSFDPIYARESLSVINDTAAGLGQYPPANRVQTNTFTPSNDFWFSAHYTWITNQDNYMFVGFVDAGTVRLALRTTGVAQQIAITKRTAAGVLTDLATATGSVCNSLCKLDVHVQYGVAGQVDVYNNGVLIATYTGDVTTDGATTLNAVYMGNTRFNAAVAWSEIIVADIDTRSLRLLSCVPQAAGTPQDWSGAAVGNINEITINDANFNSTTNGNERSNWTLCALPAGVQAIVNIHTCSRMSRGLSGGPQNFRHSLESTGNQYDNGIDINPNPSFNNFCHDWGGTSPATGVNWTPAEFATMETGVISKP